MGTLFIATFAVSGCFRKITSTGISMPGVDEAHPGTRVLYFSRSNEKATQRPLNRIVSPPIYPNVTIRNWNTTTKLVRMMDG